MFQRQCVTCAFTYQTRHKYTLNCSIGCSEVFRKDRRARLVQKEAWDFEPREVIYRERILQNPPKCYECGERLYGKRTGTRYCSNPCYQRAYRRMRQESLTE